MKRQISPGLVASVLISLAILATGSQELGAQVPPQTEPAAPATDEGQGCQTDADCPNTNPCIERNICQPGLGRCFKIGPERVDDENPCTIDTCDPWTGRVSHLAIPPGTLTCPALPPRCGNGVVEAQEECEPPNTIRCDSRCRLINPPAPPEAKSAALPVAPVEKKPSPPPPAPPVPPQIQIEITKGDPLYFCFTGEIVAYHSMSLKTVDLEKPCPPPPAEVGRTVPPPNPAQERLVQSFEQYDETRDTGHLKQVQEAIGHYLLKTVEEAKPALMRLTVPSSQEGTPSRLADLPQEIVKKVSSFRYEEGGVKAVDRSQLQLFDESDPAKKDHLLILADARPYYAKGGCSLMPR